MSRAWSAEPPGAGTNLKLARSIARKLCRVSLAWARTFVVSASPSRTGPPDASGKSPQPAAGKAPLEQQMFAEVLAYGLCLLEMRLSAALPAEREALVTLVWHECRALLEQAERRRRNRHRRLPAPAPSPGGSRYAQLYPACRTDGEGRARLTREMFEQFCRCTGLGSDVLVGKGENLATLVFYIAVHGVLSASKPPTREEVLKLLRAARECRTHLEGAISE